MRKPYSIVLSSPSLFYRLLKGWSVIFYTHESGDIPRQADELSRCPGMDRRNKQKGVWEREWMHACIHFWLHLQFSCFMLDYGTYIHINTHIWGKTSSMTLKTRNLYLSLFLTIRRYPSLSVKKKLKMVSNIYKERELRLFWRLDEDQVGSSRAVVSNPRTMRRS